MSQLSQIDGSEAVGQNNLPFYYIDGVDILL